MYNRDVCGQYLVNIKRKEKHNIYAFGDIIGDLSSVPLIHIVCKNENEHFVDWILSSYQLSLKDKRNHATILSESKKGVQEPTAFMSQLLQRQN